MNKIGIDTNVFIYALDANSIYHQKCANLLEDNAKSLFTTSKTLSEYIAVCTKLGVEHSIMYNFYQEIKQNTTVLFPSSTSLVLFEQLVQTYKPQKNRVYDIEIVSIFLAEGISEIASLNYDDFKNIKEITLFDFQNIA